MVVQNQTSDIVKLNSISLPIDGKTIIYSAHSPFLMSAIVSNRSHKTIVVSKKNYNALKKLGHVGDSFDDVIGALLSKIETKDETIGKEKR
jgi:hypothetical protein